LNVWQIATGETGRDYRTLFFDHDIMIIGPGDDGLANEENYAEGPPNSEKRQVHSFAHNPKPGDRVLMRFGKEIIGVGQIPIEDENQYSFDETFRCVYGWDLCHCRRVVWATEPDLGKLVNVYKNAKQKPSFTQVHEKNIVEEIRQFEIGNFDRPLKELPTINSEIYSEEEMGVELFQAGISDKNIEEIMKALQQAKRLCSWYWFGDCGRRPTEHEIVSHMILPLFLGLGWSHQQIAVEWNYIDMAFFKTTPTKKDTCKMVLEAKGLGFALSEVLDQPKRYVEKLGLKNVKYIVTTDGADLFVYEKADGVWNQNPVAYLSIRSLQKEYILPKGTKAIDVLVRLQPNAV
jgi:hypothetical protein